MDLVRRSKNVNKCKVLNEMHSFLRLRRDLSDGS